ncbi:cbb3-type cytochrome c oxidase subunit 3 [Methyloceanibacter sp.]|jgi:cytochrome c oxidase cbb3-type subunit 4|uniref:cbb3-type cytochrome c oxidase subunit 3 n=1 Tax=Methyloceanibacter sp. TaxID=1965321 RepID=UPI002D62125A|nr:cbb3-type cytochrome c oxidase subunit 3 [Methyloceanibacter sp.]HZP08668.1 cbb3-type cytochrome c oxidase subunit 3 [Methyloceanibacter sp.]
MSYEQVASISQVVALIFFIVLFAAVVLYAFWPGNKKRFERAARMPLEKDPENDEKDG